MQGFSPLHNYINNYSGMIICPGLILMEMLYHYVCVDSYTSSTQSITPVGLYFLQSAFVNSHFEDWSVNSKVAGQVKSGGGMTFVAVEAAGHMVPMDQPQVVGHVH